MISILKVVYGGKALLYQVANEIKKEVSNRRKNGEKEWDTFEYVVGKCKERGLKASEAAAILTMIFRLRND